MVQSIPPETPIMPGRDTDPLFTALVESAADAVIAVDGRSRVILWNPAAELLFGYGREEALGKPVGDILLNTDELMDDLAGHSHGHGEQRSPENRTFNTLIRKKDGTTIPAEVLPFRKVDTQDTDGRSGTNTLLTLIIRASVQMDAAHHKTQLIADLDKARKEADSRARQQEAVAALGIEALSEKDPLKLMDRALGQITEILGMDFGGVLEYKPEENAFLLKAGSGWREGVVGQIVRDVPLESQATQILATRHAVIVENLDEQPEFKQPPLLLTHGVKSGIGVPIAGNRGLWGVLGGHCTRPRKFTEDDIHYMQSVANVLAMAIERNESERILRESEERYARVLAGSNDGMWEWDITTGEVMWNDRLFEMYGLDRRTFTPTKDTFMELLHPDDRERIAETIRRHLEEGAPYDMEFRMRHADGHYVINTTRAKAIRDENGVPRKMAGVTTDLTEKKQAEQALHQTESMLRKLIDSSTVGILFADPDGTVSEANNAFLNIIGYDRDELAAGKIRWPELTPPEYSQLDTEKWQELLAKGECGPFEKQYLHKDGHRVDVLIAGVKLDKPETRCLTFVLDITKQKHTERILNESEARFRNLADTAPMYMAMADETGNATYFNKPWLEYTGRTMEEMAGLGWLCTLHPEDQPKFEAEFKHAFEQQIPIREEYRFRRADGEYRWMLAVGAPRFSPDGQFIGYFGTYTDFHDLKLTQLALEESEKRFRMLADSAPIMIWHSGEDGTMEYFNKNWLDFVGKTLEEELPWNWKTHIHPDDVSICTEAYMKALQNKEPFTTETRMIRKDGAYRWILTTGVPRFSPDGKFAGLVGTCKDITERKQAEQAIQESEERFRTMADSSPVLIWVTDKDNKSTYFNKTWLEFRGRTMEEEAGDGWCEGIHPDDVDRCMEICMTAKANLADINMEFRLRRADGEYRWMLDTATPRFTPSGEFAGYIGSCVDITDRKLAEMRMSRMIASNIIGVVFWNRQGQIMDANDHFLNMVGYTREEMQQGKIIWREMTPPEFAHLDEDAFAQMDATGVCRPYEKQYIHKDGRRIDILLGVANFEGNIEEGVAFILDITQRKRTEQALATRFREEQLTREVLETISQSMDPAHILQATAKKLCDYYGADRCIVLRMEQEGERLNVDISGQYCTNEAEVMVSTDDIPADIMAFLTRNIPIQHMRPTLIANTQEQYMENLEYRLRDHQLPETEIPRYLTFSKKLLFERYRIQSSLRVAICYRGKFYGHITLHQCAYQRTWTEDEIKLLESIAEHVGNALFQSELYLQEQLSRKEMESSNALLSIISEAQNHFITNEDIYTLFEEPLAKLLTLTESEYGFIGEVMNTEDGKPYLKCNFLTNIAWDEETRKLYEQSLKTGMEFHEMDNLFGRVITTGEVVISNDPDNDDRRALKGRPAGHPPLKAFLGMPFHKEGKLLGMIGIANRPGGYDTQIADYLQPFLTACANIIEGHRNERLRQELTRELKRSERSLKIYANRLEQSNKELEHFATIASHDLQAPLRKVQIFSDQLRLSLGDSLNREAIDYLDRMQRATRRMQNLITDLLVLSRITRKARAFRDVDLNEVMSDVLLDLEDVIKETGGRVEVGPMCAIQADRTQIQQLLQNLVGNGLKFNRPGIPPVVKVSSSIENDALCKITVSDNGIGFKEEYHERIFEVFERLHADTEYSGTGIGLAICKKIAERHGGSISVRSVPGRGSEFTVALPVRHVPDPTADPE